MATKTYRHGGQGPFRPEQLRPGDPYELSNGHPIECLPADGGADGQDGFLRF